jgi:hypothetical protein
MNSPDPGAAPARESGLATCVNVVIAPRAAFALLNRVPMWGWAACIGFILIVGGGLLALPATMHFTRIAQEQQLAQLSADQRAAAEQVIGNGSFIATVIAITLVFVPWISWLITAVVFMIGAAIGGGEARFKLAWTASVNVWLIGGIGSVVNGIIMALRGPESAVKAIDLQALPSLGMLAGGNIKLAAFLYAYNVFNLWLYVLSVIALELTLKASRTPAIAIVVVLSLLFGGLAALGAK